MGWTGQQDWVRPSDVRKYIESLWRDSENWRVVRVASKAFGRRVWLLAENKETARREIILYLVDTMGSYYGYKSMSEDMGPFHYDCPISLLEAASPPQSDYAVKWRAKVQESHKRRSRTFQVNDLVVIYGKQYMVFKVRTRNTYLVKRCSDGRVFKTTSSKMDFENGLAEARSMARAK